VVTGRLNLWPHCATFGAMLLLGACGGGGSAGNGAAGTTASAAQYSSSVTRPVTQSDAEIAALIYSDSQRTPAGFYTEVVPTFSGYIATSHLKNSDITANASTQYELCSDDFNQALQWSETANSNGVNANLVGNETTDQYFEFDRVRNGTPQGYLRARVYKCSYLNRNNVDLQLAQGAAGTLNFRPLSAAALQSLVEYLWQFTSYNNFGNVVLSSSATTASSGIAHSLFIATLSSATGGSTCDTVNVIEWKHSLDTSSGALNLSVTPLWSFHAQYKQGVASTC